MHLIPWLADGSLTTSGGAGRVRDIARTAVDHGGRFVDCSLRELLGLRYTVNCCVLTRRDILLVLSQLGGNGLETLTARSGCVVLGGSLLLLCLFAGLLLCHRAPMRLPSGFSLFGPCPSMDVVIKRPVQTGAWPGVVDLVAVASRTMLI